MRPGKYLYKANQSVTITVKKNSQGKLVYTCDHWGPGEWKNTENKLYHYHLIPKPNRWR